MPKSERPQKGETGLELIIVGDRHLLYAGDSVWTPLQTSLVSELSPLTPAPSLLCFLWFPLFFVSQDNHLILVQIPTH